MDKDTFNTIIDDEIEYHEKRAQWFKKAKEEMGMMSNDRRNKLNESAVRHYMLADLLKVFKEIWESGDCNICAFKGHCEIEPDAGQLVRYNCYHYEGREE